MSRPRRRKSARRGWGDSARDPLTTGGKHDERPPKGMPYLVSTVRELRWDEQKIRMSCDSGIVTWMDLRCVARNAAEEYAGKIFLLEDSIKCQSALSEMQSNQMIRIMRDVCKRAVSPASSLRVVVLAHGADIRSAGPHLNFERLNTLHAFAPDAKKTPREALLQSLLSREENDGVSHLFKKGPFKVSSYFPVDVCEPREEANPSHVLFSAFFSKDTTLASLTDLVQRELNFAPSPSPSPSHPTPHSHAPACVGESRNGGGWVEEREGREGREGRSGCVWEGECGEGDGGCFVFPVPKHPNAAHRHSLCLCLNLYCLDWHDQPTIQELPAIKWDKCETVFLVYRPDLRCR